MAKFEADTGAVAAMVGVPAYTIRNWASRGHIQPVRAEGTRTIYDVEAVSRVARQRGYLPDVRPEPSGYCCAPRCHSTAWADVPVPLCEKCATAIWLHVNDEMERRLPEPEAGSLPERLPVVYFIRSADLIKIGTTTCLRERLASLSTGTPQKPELLRVVAGDQAEEKRIHVLFRDERVRGEWFRPSERLLAFIAERRDQDIRHTHGLRAAM